MDLATLSESKGRLYVPAFAVRLAGKDLLRDHAVAVTSGEVDLSLGAAGRFSFSIANSFDPDAQEFLAGQGRSELLKLLTFGAPVEIAVGYGDASSLPKLITGVITQIATSFSQGGSPELTVSGYDNAFPMMGGKNTRAWTKKRDSEAVEEIAGFHNLIPDAPSTKQEEDQIEQNQESDLEFINKLAKRNGCEVYVTDRTLHFRPPQNQGDGVVTLEWGKGLLSFKPDANLAGQISGVEIYGWDPETKQEIIGRANHGQEPGRDPRRESAGDTVGRVMRERPVLRVRQPVFSMADANSRAQALLKDQAEQFLTGEGETIGLPEVRPDRNITLRGLGRKFSKTYYVHQTTHHFGTDGYLTRFKVKEITL
jgi:phage protein D